MPLGFVASLFDYNGVLVDDETVHLAAFQDVLRPLGVELSEQEYWSEYLGFDDRGVFETVLERKLGVNDPERVSQLVEQKQPCYLARAETALRGFPGAADLLRRRARTGPVVVVSGALRSEIELGLRFLGVEGCVNAIVSAEDTTHSKPDPEGYLLGIAALQRLHVEAPARQSLVIEDSLEGIRAAKAAGLFCLAVEHSYPANELRQAGADHVVPTIADITEDVLAGLDR